jgi:hypothetical protein
LNGYGNTNALGFDLVAKRGMAIHAIQVKSEALHDNKKTIQWTTQTPSGFYTEEDFSYFALVMIPRDEIWWVPVSEVTGKTSICTNVEKDVLIYHRLIPSADSQSSPQALWDIAPMNSTMTG